MTADPAGPLPGLDLASLRRAYRDRATTPREVVAAARERALADDHHAWLQVLTPAQLEPYLAALDRADPLSLPLFGVPFAIKDNIDLAGIPTTAACPAYEYLPERSATVVERLVSAGAVPLGKTNLDQFATGLVGTRSPYGECANAFVPAFVSGGSSAGSAVATALGQVSFALGTDTAGSGRVPCVLNNIVGWKPTRGLVSTRGVVPACRTLDCVSLMALTADDLAALLPIAGGYDAADPFSRELAAPAPASPAARFRFGLPDGLACDPALEALYRAGAAALEALGGTAVAAAGEPFLEAARLLYEGPWIAERQVAIDGVADADLLPVIREVIRGAPAGTAADLFEAQYRLAALKRTCDEMLETVDCVLFPTTPIQPTRAEVAAAPVAVNARLGTFTNFLNLLDYCAVAVPTGFTAAGVPWGVSLVGPAGSDSLLLARAAALQRALGLPLGATGRAQPPAAPLSQPESAEMTLAVFGAHLSDQPLNWQLADLGARLEAAGRTAPAYALYALPDGRRPAVVRTDTGGTAIELELWSLPRDRLGEFIGHVEAPLAIGTVELDDGREVKGFVCEMNGLGTARDVSGYGGWRAWLAAAGK